jgi:hypothetical protein
MGADYYTADTENGNHIDDPSEDALFMLLEDLNQAGNTFITITPASDDPAWHASVTLLPTVPPVPSKSKRPWPQRADRGGLLGLPVSSNATTPLQSRLRPCSG